jgi:hypothetical protein
MSAKVQQRFLFKEPLVMIIPLPTVFKSEPLLILAQEYFMLPRINNGLCFINRWECSTFSNGFM